MIACPPKPQPRAMYLKMVRRILQRARQSIPKPVDSSIWTFPRERLEQMRAKLLAACLSVLANISFSYWSSRMWLYRKLTVDGKAGSPSISAEASS